MEPPVIDDDELLEEALAILDSVDIARLGSGATGFSLSDPSAQEMPSNQAAADELLQTAIQAVQAAFPHNNNHPTTGSSKNAVSTKQKQTKPAITSAEQRIGPVIGTNTATPRSRGRGGGGGRTRMREQLIQLRAVVQKMEGHLETLRSPRSSRFTVCSEDGEAGQNLPSDEHESSRANAVEQADGPMDEVVVWRNIAIQQFHARRHAEQQNAELRESLAAQMHLSKQVKDLLQGQPHPNGLFEGQQSALQAEDGVMQNDKDTKESSNYTS